MRLGQLARKLEITPEKLISLLADHGIEVPYDANAKIADDDVETLLKSTPSWEAVTEPPAIEAIQAPEDKPEPVQVPELQSPEPVTVAVPEPQIIPEETPELEKEVVQKEKPELIKAPKVALPGLKVLGKIELPEPTPKSQKETKKKISEAEKKAKTNNRNTREKRKPRQHSLKNGKTRLELQREKEVREAEKQKRIAEKKKKERRKQRYAEKMATVTKPTLKKKKEVSLTPTAIKSIQRTSSPPPKTWMGKFWRWLNT